MKRIIENYRLAIDRGYVWQIFLAVTFLIISFILNYYSSLYATRMASNPVSDIILSNIRVRDVSWFFVYGPAVFWSFFLILCLVDPKRISFSVKTIALFVVIRAVFVVLSHLAPFPDQLVIDHGNKLSSLFSTGGSLFFSGHTGAPFLLALIFWKDKVLRYIMLAASVFFAAIVLLGHLHYTIDVLGAFFITYTIYALAEVFFKKDREYFYHGPAGKRAPEPL